MRPHSYYGRPQIRKSVSHNGGRGTVKWAASPTIQINLTLSDSWSLKLNSTPDVGKDSSALPSVSKARTLCSSIDPKPLRDGGFTAGPPLSRHVKSTSVGFNAGFATQEILTRPASIDSAPYLAAF